MTYGRHAVRKGIVLWTVIPNHYQSAFIEALRSRGLQVSVRYYNAPDRERLEMGWSEYQHLPPGELYVAERDEVVEDIAEWRECIHIVPGYSRPFLRRLIYRFAREHVCWAHWSEDSNPGWRRPIRFPLKRWYAGMVNRYALGAFGTGLRALQDFARWGIKKEKSAILPYSNSPIDGGPSADEVCTRFLEGRRAFVFVGSLYHGKGIDVFLKAFNRITGASKGWTAIFVGNDCANGQYQRMAVELGIAEQVLFRGPVAASQIGNVLRAASVFVLPSRYDGWGVALAEAASAGLPLISTDRCGSAYHLIEPGRNGFRVRAGDPAGLGSAMRSYTENSALMAHHGQHSKHLFKEYTPERNVDRFVGALETWSAMATQPSCSVAR